MANLQNVQKFLHGEKASNIPGGSNNLGALKAKSRNAQRGSRQNASGPQRTGINNNLSSLGMVNGSSTF